MEGGRVGRTGGLVPCEALCGSGEWAEDDKYLEDKDEIT